MEFNNKLFISIESLIDQQQGLHFIVKDYQRGYKWTEEHIAALLKDIDDHKEIDGKYCLQPLIVAKAEADNSYELIDGQQRMTSIYLLVTYLNEGAPVGFRISYDTRKKSREFILEKVPELFIWLEANLDTEPSWGNFIMDPTFLEYDNIDVYHFFIVARRIVEWFNEKSKTVIRLDFKIKLLSQVHIIWYDISDNVIPSDSSKVEKSSEDIFLNLNAGKIPLTGSELIKALFILELQRDYSKEIATLKAKELAKEWDTIEIQLHDDGFWYFVCNDSHYSEDSTRIDFLLDLVNNITVKDRFSTYREYEKRFQENQVLDWSKIKNVYNKLLEWYNDKEIYHYVGFLVASKLSKLGKLINASAGKSKLVFKDHLKDLIRKEFSREEKNENDSLKKIYDFNVLNYEDHNDECRRLLLLLNVQYYVNGHSSHRFPFDLFQKDKWSVEHINPQNPRDFTSWGALKDWVEAHVEYFESGLNSVDKAQTKIAIIERGKFVLKGLESKDGDKRLEWSELPTGIIESIESLVVLLTAEMDLHQIGNLALLDKVSNSRLSNQSFLKKRELIIEFDQNGHDQADNLPKPVFIPVCTKNVFVKIYTTDQKRVTDRFFGKADNDGYIKFIKTQLKDFFK